MLLFWGLQHDGATLYASMQAALVDGLDAHAARVVELRMASAVECVDPVTLLHASGVDVAGGPVALLHGSLVDASDRIPVEVVHAS